MKISRSIRSYGLLVLILLLSFNIVNPIIGKSLQLLNRSITIGNSVISANTQYKIDFDYSTVGSVGSVKFEFCENSPLVYLPCVPPAGIDVSASVLAVQSGETGFIVDPLTTTSTIVLSRPSALTSVIPSSYTFTNVSNPSLNTTTFVRVTTYASIDTSGPFTDDGSMAFSTVDNVTVNGFVPPYLSFCVGVTVAVDCSSASGQQLNFGELSKTSPNFLTSQFAGATNDPGGFSTSVTGITMTSGTNVIPALNGFPQSSQAGTSQFGMNLRFNSSPAVGSDPIGVGTSVISPQFNVSNNFFFNNQVVTNSTLPTDYNVFTVSYLVNVSNSQSPGVYNTTLTYIAIAAF